MLISSTFYIPTFQKLLQTVYRPDEQSTKLKSLISCQTISRIISGTTAFILHFFSSTWYNFLQARVSNCNCVPAMESPSFAFQVHEVSSLSKTLNARSRTADKWTPVRQTRLCFGYDDSIQTSKSTLNQMLTVPPYLKNFEFPHSTKVIFNSPSRAKRQMRSYLT